MKKVSLGIVYSPSAPQMDSLICSVQGLGNVDLILPDTRSARFDIIIIPHSGVNPNLRTFSIDSYQALPMTPICPFVERFREQSLPFYLESDISVIALGDSRAILYDILGLKTAATSVGLMFLNPKLNNVNILKGDSAEVEDFIASHSETAILAGFKGVSPRLTNCLLDKVQSILVEAKHALADNNNNDEEPIDEYV